MRERYPQYESRRYLGTDFHWDQTVVGLYVWPMTSKNFNLKLSLQILSDVSIDSISSRSRIRFESEGRGVW